MCIRDRGNSSSNDNDLYLLARLVYGEARGEPYKGQVAVAAVVLNRVESSEFPNSVSGVIYQSGAFDVVADGQINLSPVSYTHLHGGPGRRGKRHPTDPGPARSLHRPSGGGGAG